MDDQSFMSLALDLAELAKGKTNPNPMVGAIIVRDNIIVGRGYHKKAGTPHAEIHALQQAGELARGATMYVTLEPCSHHGKTPPCSEAVIKAGLTRVVVAVEDPNPLVAGRGIGQLRKAGIEVTVGVKEQEARQLNEAFFKYITTQKPFVLVKTAMTLDGKIATDSGDSRWVTGELARAMVHRWRSWYDAILVGIGTVLADDPLLTARVGDEDAKNPIRIVLDSQGRIPLDSALLCTAREVPTIIVATKEIAEATRSAIEHKGAEVLIIPSVNGKSDLEILLGQLGKRGITSLLVEGGAVVNATFFATGMVDKVACFVAPKIIGGKEAPGPVGDMGFTMMREAVSIKDLKVTQVGNDFLLEGYPERLEQDGKSEVVL